MAKVQIKSEKITPSGEIFHVREQFSRFVGSLQECPLSYRQTNVLTIQIHSPSLCQMNIFMYLCHR